jgi:DNA-binding MarR family transcriptional regulator
MTARPSARPDKETGMPQGWTFLTNHAHVLLAVARTPDALVRDLAATVGISERAALTILSDLEAAGYLHRTRLGRRTRYTLHAGQPFRHATTAAHRIDELIAIFTTLAPRDPSGAHAVRPEDGGDEPDAGRDQAPLTTRSLNDSSAAGS